MAIAELDRTVGELGFRGLVAAGNAERLLRLAGDAKPQAEPHRNFRLHGEFWS